MIMVKEEAFLAVHSGVNTLTFSQGKRNLLYTLTGGKIGQSNTLSQRVAILVAYQSKLGSSTFYPSI